MYVVGKIILRPVFYHSAMVMFMVIKKITLVISIGKKSNIMVYYCFLITTFNFSSHLHSDVGSITGTLARNKRVSSETILHSVTDIRRKYSWCLVTGIGLMFRFSANRVVVNLLQCSGAIGWHIWQVRRARGARRLPALYLFNMLSLLACGLTIVFISQFTIHSQYVRL